MTTERNARQTAAGKIVAKFLLDIKAVNFRPEEPYKLTAGWASPVYIDCRKIISYPRLRSTLIDFAATTIVRDIGYESLDIIAGGETAGIGASEALMMLPCARAMVLNHAPAVTQP